jgi:hypothetical protein
MNNGKPFTMLDLCSISPEQAARRIEGLIKQVAELEKERGELIKEFSEAECMGDLAKITRQYGYEALKEQE